MVLHDLSPQGVKDFRLKHSMSQKAFAEKIGVSQSRVSLAERKIDKLDADYIMRIRRAFSTQTEIKPPVYKEPSFWKKLKLRIRWEFGLFNKELIRPTTFEAFKRKVIMDEASR